jgi:hypothetical protein
MSLLTRGVVVASALAAAFVEVDLATTPLHPQIFWISIAGAIVMFAAGALVRFAAVPTVMAAIYLMPAVYLGLGMRELYSLEVIWILPLLGLALSGRDAWKWSLPRSWQWPLVTWALVVSVSWPIVFLRELDFYPPILQLDHVSNTSIGIFPGDAGTNIAYFALGQLMAILWLDTLFRWYARAQPRAFRRQVLMPLAIAAAAASAVAIYQGFVDLAFLNSGFWAYMLRASGTLGDPNKLGMIAAFWAIGSVALARTLSRPWSLIVSIGGVLIAIAGIWTSGTRTGLAAVMIGLVALGIEGLRHWRSQSRAAMPGKRIAAVAAVVVVLAAALVLLLQQANTHTVFGRGVLGYLPIFGDIGVGQSVNELLWERNGYGPAAVQMLREHPVAGVGVGAYHTLVHDFGTLFNYDILPDNAQSWYRHLVAELGLLGSVPWIWWCVVFGAQLFSRTHGAGDRLTAGILRGALVGFAIASLFGMAGQSMPVIVTFITFVFWFAVTKGIEGSSGLAWTRPTMMITAALVVVHAAMTFADASGDLLPRHRATRFDWFYRYGLSDIDPDPGGGPGRRWTMTRAVAVIPVQGKVLKFVGWIDHPDADENPVQVRVWADAKLVHSGDLKRSAAITLDIPAAPGASHMEIETRISRLWRPSDYGREDRRQLGLSIRDWQWE